MPQANYTTAADAFDQWRDNLLTGTPPTLYPIGSGEMGRIETGPGLVTLIGGAPGAGKTAFTMQAAVDALRLTPTLRALVCNIEMSPAVLLDRQLARLSGIDLGTIRHRRFGPEHAERLHLAMDTLEAVADRLAFVRPPFTLENVAASADAFGAELLVLDYIQRISPPGDHSTKRHAVDATMNFLRQFADAGTALLVVAAVSRGKDAAGRSTYDSDALSLASFRESSELEFGADDAFILVPSNDRDEQGAVKVTLRHLKSRYGEPRDVVLDFHRPTQRFTPTAAPTPAGRRRGRPPGNLLQEELAAAWAQTQPAADDEEEAF
mgnify:CR=1 FL=1